VSSSFTARVGAVGNPPEHYGNPLGEQKALAAGRAIVDLSDRAVLTVSGIDRLTWLDSLTSQLVAGLLPGESAETLLLDPTGRLQYAIRLFDDGETAWLLVDAAEAPPLLVWLDRMRFMLRVEVADRSADFATLGALAVPVAPFAPVAPVAQVAPVAPFASENEGVTDASVGRDPEHPLDAFAAAPNGVPLVWVDPWRAVVAGGHQYSTAAKHPGTGWFYREVLVDRALVDGAGPPAVDALAAFPAAGTLALEALRIAAWRPRLASEADEKTLPHELDWLRSAVHLSKGCYRGQETVAKVHNLGHPPRRLVMLHLDGSEGVLPSPGAEVMRATAEAAVPAAIAPEAAIPAEATPEAAIPAAIAPEVAVPAAIPAEIAPEAAIPAEHLAAAAAIGRVTSSALHYELGPIALAVIKRNVPTEAALVVRTDGIDIAAAQEVIVPPGAGAEANVPRLPRLGAVTR